MSGWYVAAVISASGRRRGSTKWSIDSHEVHCNGDYRIDLRTVTKAHYSTFNFNGVGNGGLHLFSPTQQVVIYQLKGQKQLKQAVVKTLETLHRSAPHVPVHMRGGPTAEVLNLLTGLAFLGIAAWVAFAVLFGAGEFSGTAVGFVVLLTAFGGFLVQRFYPWNRQRYYATPKQAASAIRQHDWRVAYHSFGTRSGS